MTEKESSSASAKNRLFSNQVFTPNGDIVPKGIQAMYQAGLGRYGTESIFSIWSPTIHKNPRHASQTIRALVFGKGVTTLSQLRELNPDELLEVKGLGVSKVPDILEWQRRAILRYEQEQEQQSA